MTHIVAVCNQKGGVGKTTLTINLGAALAHLGQQVLLVDLDPQGHLTEGVGLHDAYLTEQVTLYHALVGPHQAVTIGIDQLIQHPPTEPFAVIPSSFELMLAEQALYMARNREHKLAGLLAQLGNQYDWVLIDCPPVLGNLTDNALNAARAVIIPIQAEATSVRALGLLFDQIESVEQGLNITVQVLAVVPNLVQDSAIAKRILAELRQAIPELTPFELRKRVLLQAAWRAGQSIFGYQPTSHADTQTRQEITGLYEQLAQFVMARVRLAGQAGMPERSVAVIPDAWFELSVSTGQPKAIAVELDRGTEDQRRWRGKVEALAAWAAGPYQEAFGTETLTIAIVTPDEARWETLRTWTGQELARIGAPELAEIFLVTSADPVTTTPAQFFFDRCWYEPAAAEPISLLLPPPRPALTVVPPYTPGR